MVGFLLLFSWNFSPLFAQDENETDNSAYRLNPQDNTITIRSNSLEIIVRDGQVITLNDLITGESFSSPGSNKLPVGKKSPGIKGIIKTELKKLNGNADIVYTCEENRKKYQIVFGIEIIKPSGDVKITPRYKNEVTGTKRLDILIPSLKTQGIILGNGTRFTKEYPDKKDSCIRIANNLHSPPVAVLEGTKGSIFIWPDSIFDGNLSIIHTKQTDQLILDSKTPLPGEKRIPTGWMISRVGNWVQAVRRYRAFLKEKYQAEFLWERKNSWTSGIHAVYKGYPGHPHGAAPTKEKAEEFYKNLAGRFNPSGLLLFYWNGNGIVLFGDHRYTTKIGYPKEPATTYLKKYGFRWMGYHPYTLIMAPHYIPKRLAEFAKTGNLPPDYTFKPDYNGEPDKFNEYFRNVAAGYYGTLESAKKLWVLHPGAEKTLDYLLRNFPDYCAFHNMDGSYFDIMGANSGHHFNESKKVINGRVYNQGAWTFIKTLANKRPDLGVMSECQSPWTTLKTFYTWEGYSHISHPARYKSRSKVNHPMRTAIWGSFTWTRENGLEVDNAVLLGTLPGYKTGDQWAEKRCKFFIDEELYNDLPPEGKEWGGNQVLAWYRGKNNKWYQFKKMPFGDAYVQDVPGNQKIILGRCFGRTRTTFKQPISIQNWLAYDNKDQAIGLNPSPDRKYPFTIEKPKTEFFRITELPDGVHIDSIRHHDKYSVIEFKPNSNPISSGKVALKFYQKCRGISTGKEDLNKPVEKDQTVSVTMDFPGGMVIKWQESKAATGTFTNHFIGKHGNEINLGLPKLGWMYNSRCYLTRQKINGLSIPAISIGPGVYKGYVENWIKLAPNAKPILRFILAGKPAKGCPDFYYLVKMNGREIFRKKSSTEDKLSSEVCLDLSKYSGRTVLLTLTVEYERQKDLPPGNRDKPGYFAHIRIDNNPDPLTPVKPADPVKSSNREIFGDFFSNAKCIGKEWKPFISPDAGEGSGISIVDGKLLFKCKHYKYCYLKKKLVGKEKDLRVQARLNIRPTGCNPARNPGICLFWDKQTYLFVTGGGYRDEKIIINVGGQNNIIPLKKFKMMHITKTELYDFFVRVELGEKKMVVMYSADMEHWEKVFEKPRVKNYLQPPSWLILGRGGVGKGEFFSNDLKHNTPLTEGFISELKVESIE